MLTRTKRVTLTFQHPFSLEGVDRSLTAGDYEVVTDEELIEGLVVPGLPPGRDNDLLTGWRGPAVLDRNGQRRPQRPRGGPSAGSGASDGDLHREARPL